MHGAIPFELPLTQLIDGEGFIIKGVSLNEIGFR